MKPLAFATAFVLSLSIASSYADTPAPATVKQRIEQYAVTYRLQDDLTHVEEHRYRTRVLDEDALDDAKHATISYSSSVQQVEIVEAFTLKADGRRIPVPADNFQEKANTGHRGSGPVFSDHATLGLVFPEVAVGDAVALHYRIVQTEPIFPGEFDIAETFSKSAAYDDVRIVIDAPARVVAKIDVREMAQASEERDGRRILSLSWKNPVPVRETRQDWSVIEPADFPGFAWSTFADYGEIARAYGVRALPRALPTPAVRKLAAEVTRGVKDRREKARLLYEWVARNITYAGNCVGVGAVVPHETDFILGNRMGDCKDHATLLQALLAAQGIRATQALVNAGGSYELAPVPLVSAVNHVINYIPEFDLYLDSTSSETPWGHLPRPVAGKPVLLVEHYRDGLRTPMPAPESNQQSLESEVEYLSDGTARGRMAVTQRGVFAIDSRSRARRMSTEDVDEYLHRLFDNDGRKGFGRIEQGDARPLTADWRFDLAYESPASLDLPGAGGLYLYAPMGTAGGIGGLIDAGTDSAEPRRFACHGGLSEEKLVLKLPAGTVIYAIPDDLHVERGVFRYDATYRREGTTITAWRKLEDRTAGPVCEGGQFLEFREFSRQVSRDLRAQIVYQLKDVVATASP